VEVPAAAVSGPAPDAAAAAPINSPVFGAIAAGVGAAGAAGGAATDGPPAAADAPAASVGLPALGTVGSIAGDVTTGPAAARELLSSGTGRSLAFIMALLGAIGVFLAVHRRADRGDRRLAAARSGPDVARFR
jgi:hypothetical protein